MTETPNTDKLEKLVASGALDMLPGCVTCGRRYKDDFSLGLHIGGQHPEVLRERAFIQIPNSMRTELGEHTYQQAKKEGRTIPLMQEPSKRTFVAWKVVANRFPYDKIFRTHDMLIPLRQFSTREEMTPDEAKYLLVALKALDPLYDVQFENFSHRKSVSGHFHIHLASWKNRESV